MAEVDLLFKTLFLPSLDDDSELCDSLFTDPNRVGDGAPNPVKQFFEKVALAQELGKSAGDWDEIIGAPLEKRESDDAGGDYLSVTELRKLWKSIVRTEQVQDAEGLWWSNGYDAKGELVDARIITDA